MTIMESYCRLCSEHLESYVEFASLEHLTEIQKINFPIPADSKICTSCFDFLLKIQNFIENSYKVQNFLNFVATNSCDVTSTRTSFGLSSTKCHQFTDTHDLGEEIAVVEILEKIDEVICDENNENEREQEDEEMQEERLDEETNEEDIKNESEINFEEFEYNCHLCNENFKTFFALHAHTRKIHDELPKVFCPCGATLSSRSQIHHHKKIHKSSKSVLSCPNCEKIYTHAQSLQNHIKKCHATSQNTYECSKCLKVLDSERKLKVHEQTHLPDDKKLLHACPIESCAKKFSKSVNVQAHVRAIHGKERPFLCSQCGKTFSTKGAQKEHQIIHSDQFPYKCQFCEKKFKNLPRLKTHEDTHGKTQYICNVCGISLNTKRTLKMHMVVHSEIKRFKCEYCGSMFKRSKALKNHLILHSGLRPYACPFCNKTFANGSNCRSHKKKAHPQELAEFEAAGKAATTPSIPRLDELMLKGGKDQVLVIDEAGMILQDEIVVLPTNDTFQIVEARETLK